MKTEEGIVKTLAVYKDETHRLLLKKVWDEDLPSVAICMSNAGVAPSIYHSDYTSMFCVNSLSALGYGSVSIVNLFSYMTKKLDLSGDLANLTCAENMEQILQAAKECDIFIWAVGSITNIYKKVAVYQLSLFNKLCSYQDKIHCIADYNGKELLHPLSPSLRNKPWTLVPYKLPVLIVEKKEIETQTETVKKDALDKTKKASKRLFP